MFLLNTGPKIDLSSARLSLFSILVFSIISSFITFLLILFFPKIFEATMAFLVFLIVIILNTWFGGIRAGLITTTLTALSFIYFFLDPIQLQGNPFRIIQFGIFILTGSLISLIIEKYKRTDLVEKYRNREKVYVQILDYLYKANLRAMREIKARNEFLSIASHELKTPLTSMLLQIQTILYNIKHVSLNDR